MGKHNCDNCGIDTENEPLTLCDECDTFPSARVAELERERDAARADAYEKVQALAAVSGVLLGNDVPSTWDHYGAVADARKCAADRADAARLREALERLIEDVACLPVDFCDEDEEREAEEVLVRARSALASAPSAEPTPCEAYMRVAEAVRETCALHLRMSPRFEGVLTTPNDNGVLGRAAQDLENLDLAAVVAKALEVGT